MTIDCPPEQPDFTSDCLYHYIGVVFSSSWRRASGISCHANTRSRRRSSGGSELLRTMNIPRRSERVVEFAASPAPAPAPARAPAPYSNNGASGGAGGSQEALVKKEEQEETLGQLRDRLELASELTRVPARGPRALFDHIKVEDTSSGEDTDGEGGEGGGKEEEEEEEEEEEGEMEGEEEGQQREHHAQAPGDGFEGRVEAPGAVALPRRLRPPPGSYADTAAEPDTDSDYEKEDEDEDENEEDEEDEEDVEEAKPRDQRAHMPGASCKGGSKAVRLRSLTAGAHSVPGALRALGTYADNAVHDNDDGKEAAVVPALVMRGGAVRACCSRFQGVYWKKSTNKWLAQFQGKHLGYHTTEEAAAHAYNKYLKDGSVPGPVGSTSQFKGVHWDKHKNKWRAKCKETKLGYHATEEEAARAYNKYLEDGIGPVKHREAHTWHFMGVCWDKNADKWRATCKGTYLGLHTSEKSAVRAYNVEVKRVGRHLNVIPPAGAAGASASAGTSVGAGGSAGPKRTAPKTPATPATTKKTKRAAL